MRKILPLVAAAVFGIAATGHAQMEKKDAPAMHDGAKATAEGVTIKANVVQNWPGEYPITTDVTPVKVSIENNSGVPLRLRYREFALRPMKLGAEQKAQSYAALAPFRIKGEVETPVLIDDYDSIEEPGFDYDKNFRIAPLYDPIYDIEVYEDAFDYEWDYYFNSETVWKETDLPTGDMLMRVLPEGVLAESGKLGGFLYFKKLHDEAALLHFQADLVNATTGEKFGEITIPLAVEST